MKFLFSFFIMLSLFTSSCNKNNSRGNLAGADSLVINFNTKGTNTIEKTISATEKTAIKKLIRFINSKESPEYKCGYDGNIIFYKKEIESGDVSFNFSGDGCHHFIQLIGGKLASTQMSNEAADFLKSLREGKNWY